MLSSAVPATHNQTGFLQSSPTPILKLVRILITEFSRELASGLSKLEATFTSAVIPWIKAVTSAIGLALQEPWPIEQWKEDKQMGV